MNYRRQNEQDQITTWWIKISPYFHVISVVLLIAFTLGVKNTVVEAHGATLIEYGQELKEHDQRIKLLEGSIDKQNQQLRDIIDFFGINKKKE